MLFIYIFIILSKVRIRASGLLWWWESLGHRRGFSSRDRHLYCPPKHGSARRHISWFNIGFVSGYDELPECIETASNRWESCYTAFKGVVDRQKNSSQEWTHYITHFFMCWYVLKKQLRFPIGVSKDHTFSIVTILTHLVPLSHSACL